MTGNRRILWADWRSPQQTGPMAKLETMPQPIILKSPLESAILCQDDNGTVHYTVAANVAESYGLSSEFVKSYGDISEWICVETGDAIGVDLGELIAWVNSQA